MSRGSDALRALGVPQLTIASRLGVTVSAVSSWQMGQRVPCVELAAALELHFGLPRDVWRSQSAIALEQVMSERECTIAIVARRYGVRSKTVASWLSGGRVPSLSVAARLEAVCGIDAGGWDEAPEARPREVRRRLERGVRVTVQTEWEGVIAGTIARVRMDELGSGSGKAKPWTRVWVERDLDGDVREYGRKRLTIMSERRQHESGQRLRVRTEEGAACA